MQLSAPIAHQPVRVAVFRHGSARSIPSARYDRVADDFYQRVRDLVPRFFQGGVPRCPHSHTSTPCSMLATGGLPSTASSRNCASFVASSTLTSSLAGPTQL